ncbi:MAG: DUF547 domain-containing protein [Candidatus Omnitrophica bacterium]|nr:DUF547 domain-containing protein [Candidatus Omnitrophota bacterium]MCB9720052.1 DUF547 domain-containing protein [Candidatus Omnitrophota bacterium]
MRRHVIITAILFTAVSLAAAGKDQAVWAQGRHQLLTDVLSAHVSNGHVNYARLCADGRLDAYTAQLNSTDPAQLPSADARFAFWLNTYTAYSLSAICAKYPIDSVNDLHFGGMLFAVATGRSVWDKPLVRVNGRKYTLKEVDHEILRKQYADPRIQFAIACGAVGCGPVPQEAYEAEQLDAQLDRQARAFINDPRSNRFDEARQRAVLSPLFKWSRQDFGRSEDDVLLFAARYLPPDLSRNIQTDPGKWDVEYGEYDLRLDDAK